MTDSKHAYWSGQVDNLAREMSKLCIVCDIDMMQPGIAERVLKGDESVCGRKNPEVFQMLRKHLMAFFQLEEKAIARLGADDTQEILTQVRESIVRLRGEG